MSTTNPEGTRSRKKMKNDAWNMGYQMCDKKWRKAFTKRNFRAFPYGLIIGIAFGLVLMQI